MNPRYPIYIVSKGRWESRLTSKSLERMGVPYYIVVEDQEYDNYCSVIDASKVLILDKQYQKDYDIFDDDIGYIAISADSSYVPIYIDGTLIGHTPITKPIPLIDDFYRLNRNAKNIVETGTIFRCAEDFVDRYENILVAGFNYCKFCKANDAIPPFLFNTRIYSTLLIDNSCNHRWRGRYNEDTDLSLNVLKDGFCTLQFNAFLQEKATTQRLRGGNSEEFYDEEGTLNKSKMLEKMHPDVASVVWRFNRWHHYVDYKPFKKKKKL